MQTENNTAIQAGENIAVWRSHVRSLFDEIIQSNPKMQILHKPLQITLNIIGEAAAYAAQTGDEKMIGYFTRLSIYAFSDPYNADYNRQATEYYIDKTK